MRLDRLDLFAATFARPPAEALRSLLPRVILSIAQGGIARPERRSPCAVVAAGTIRVSKPTQDKVGERRLEGHVAVQTAERACIHARPKAVGVLDAEVNHARVLRAVRSPLPANVADAPGAPSAIPGGHGTVGERAPAREIGRREPTEEIGGHCFPLHPDAPPVRRS